jgi:hypothetical protein
MGGGTGQRRGEAAGFSRAVRVFKRCSEKGDVPPLWVSEGGLEHARRGNFPESGKFHVIRIPDRVLVFKYFAGVCVVPLRLAAGRAGISKFRRTAPIASSQCDVNSRWSTSPLLVASRPSPPWHGAHQTGLATPARQQAGPDGRQEPAHHVAPRPREGAVGSSRSG